MWNSVFYNLLSRRRSMLASWWISRACNVVEASRRNKIWDTNVVKQLKDVKCEGLNVRVGRRFQRFFHRVESMQVWTASLAFKKDNMWSRTQSGKSLNMSSFLSSFSLWLCLCIALFIRSKTFLILIRYWAVTCTWFDCATGVRWNSP